MIDGLAGIVRMSQVREWQCIVCGSATRDRAVFIPNDPESAGVGRPAAGKDRAVIYGICDKHTEDEYLWEIIEERIKNIMAVDLAKN